MLELTQYRKLVDMDIEIPLKPFLASVRISVSESSEVLSLNNQTQRVCFGRRQVPIKKIKDYKERPVRDFIYRDSTFISNEHCLLTVEPINTSQRLEDLMALRFFKLLPLEVVKMIVSF